MFGEDIQFVTTDDLIIELKRRHPDGIIVAMQNPPHEVNSCGHDWRITYKGKIETTLKLANIAVWMHQRDITGDAVIKEDTPA